MKKIQKTPQNIKVEAEFNEQESIKPMMVVAMIWLLVVTILSIGLGVLSVYTAATGWSDMEEVRSVLQDRVDTDQYYYDKSLQSVCTLQYRSNPDYCFSTTGNITSYTISFLVSKVVQLLVLVFGNLAMWLSNGRHKNALATALSFLTIIAWIFSSLLTPLIYSILT